MNKQEKLEIALRMYNLVNAYADRLADNAIDSSYGNVLDEDFQPDIELSEMRGMYAVLDVMYPDKFDGSTALNAFGSVISDDDITSENIEEILGYILDSFDLSLDAFNEYKDSMERSVDKNKKVYKFEIVETNTKVVFAYADSEDAADAIIEEKFCNGELSADEDSSVVFLCAGEYDLKEVVCSVVNPEDLPDGELSNVK